MSNDQMKMPGAPPAAAAVTAAPQGRGSDEQHVEGELLPLDKLLQFTGQKLCYPLDSLPNLLEFVTTRCTKLAAKRKIICGEYFNDPKPMRVILNCMGYLANAPLLRILLLHYLCKTKCVDQILTILDILRCDVRKLYISLESSLRETIVCGNTSSSSTNKASSSSSNLVPSRQQDSMVTHCEKIACFTLALRTINGRKLQDLRNRGPRPALLVLPSQIAIANFGLYVRGCIDAGVPIAGYCGEEEECDSEGSGYRMQIGQTIVDAKTERCLCSMMNDPRGSIFQSNVAFKQSRGRIVAKSLRKLKDEELFVSYGTSFSLNFEATAASFCRSLAPDFTDVVRTGTLPKLQ